MFVVVIFLLARWSAGLFRALIVLLGTLERLNKENTKKAKQYIKIVINPSMLFHISSS